MGNVNFKRFHSATLIVKLSRALKVVCCVGMLLGWMSCIDESDGSASPQQGTIVHVGDALPAFEVVALDGSVWHRDSLLNHRSALIFFNSKCPDCQRTLPVVDSLYRSMSDTCDFRLLCIAREDGEATVKAYWAAQNFKMPVSPQTDRGIYALFAHSGVPRIYLSNRKGTVCFMHDDQVLPTLQQLMEEVNACDKQ